MTSAWYVYLLLCENERLYTGITTDVRRRLAQHESGKGARFTRSNKPLALLGYTECENRSAALKLEYAIKQLSVAEKRNVVSGWASAPVQAAESVPYSL